MKYIQKVIISYCSALMFAPGCFGASIGLSVPLGGVSVGDMFTISVNAVDYLDLYAYQFDLAYDPALLSVISIDEGPFLPSGGATFFIPGAVDNAAGAASGTAGSLISLVPGVAGGGILANVQFLALAAGTSLISSSNPLFLSSTFAEIDTTVSSTPIDITPAVASGVPEPATVLTLFAGLGCLAVIRRCRSARC